MFKALIVGINEYPHSPLRGCVNDAQDVIAYLTDTLKVPHEDILPLYDHRATKTAIVQALRDMIASSSPGEHLLFHYSGHGAQIASQDESEPDGLDEALCPIDFAWGEPSTALTDNELAAILATVPGGTALTVVLDSCHSGDMKKEGKDRPRFMAPPEDIAFLRASRKRVARKRAITTANAMVVSACRSEETAADTSFGGRSNGAFTYYWLAELRTNATGTLNELVGRVTKALTQYNMHPELDGLGSLEQAQFLVTPPPVGRGPVAKRGLARTASQVVFDERWSTKVLGMDIGAELQIGCGGGGFEFQLSSDAGVPMRWSFQINGDATEQVDLGFGFRLILAVSGWRATRSDIAFDLAIQVAPPFFGPVTLTQQPVRLPIATVPRAATVPASPADLLAMIELARLGHSTEPVEVPVPVTPRDGDAQWTGIAWVEPFAGGLFGCSYNKTVDAYVPPGFIRDHIEWTLDVPDSGNVHFNIWEDSDPHIGRFQFHIGCVSCGGGRATFYMHCVRDPNVVRQTAPAAPTERPGTGKNGAPKHLTNGDAHRTPGMDGHVTAVTPS